MRKIRLSERELTNIVRRVIIEQESGGASKEEFISHIQSFLNSMGATQGYTAMDVCATLNNVCKVFAQSQGTRLDQKIVRDTQKTMTR